MQELFDATTEGSSINSVCLETVSVQPQDSLKFLVVKADSKTVWSPMKAS